MHTPGSAAHHQAHHHAMNAHHAAHHRATDMHNAAHRSAVDHARQSAFGAQRAHDVRAAQRGGYPRGGRSSGVAGLLRFVLTLAVVAVLVGGALLVLRPTQPEWLAELVQVMDALLGMLRSAVS